MSNFQLKTSVAQKGFTLIEMSIVLVIIGLIIGGILKGQEIIDASRQKNFISQTDSYRSALNTFQDRFNGIPGDYNLATSRVSSGAVNGDGDGLVGSLGTGIAGMNAITAAVSAGTGGGTAAEAGENMNFFCQLSAANLIGSASNDCDQSATTFGNGSPLPAAAFANSGLTVVWGLYDAAYTRTALWARVHRNPGSNITDTTGALSGRVASQLDGKYDDGSPVAGLMRGANTGDCPATSTSSVYTALGETPNCVMMIELLR